MNAAVQEGATTPAQGATATVETPSAKGIAGFIDKIKKNPRLLLMLAVATLVSVVVAATLYTSAPEYKILFSNVSDRDGGTIINSLQQMNVPYKFGATSGTILVPGEHVHEVRLKLAAQGLPKGGTVGFELMDTQKFGISQFAEQVNYQRALEGELARTIEAINVVQSARVHLAMPKPSVFMRDQQKPTASVVLQLYPGRVLDEGQVAAIGRLIGSSVPELPPKQVTVVDQFGNLLSGGGNSLTGLDATQLRFVQEIERVTAQRIETILNPIFGAGNVKAQVSADIDFSQAEQTAETYRPNQTPGDAALRSQQSSESMQQGQPPVGGIPGALTNQPPLPTTAPLTAASGATTTQQTTGPSNQRKDVTTNYEVDKTIRHVKQATGSVKRLSAAVVVNHKRSVDASGKETFVPLSAQQLAQVNDLVKEAMGFSAARGDSLNVVNSAFTAVPDPFANLPWWKQPENVELIKEGLRYGGIALLGLIVWFGILRPFIRKAEAEKLAEQERIRAEAEAVEAAKIKAEEEAKAALAGEDGAVVNLSADGQVLDIEKTPEQLDYESNLAFVRKLVKENPKAVASILTDWMTAE